MLFKPFGGLRTERTLASSLDFVLLYFFHFGVSRCKDATCPH